MLDLADYIDFLADDPATKVIACVMEGAKDGRHFRAAVERATRKKPVVILKLGRSEAGQAATLAHTGTLAGRHEAYEALFQRSGASSVLSLDELVETAALLATAPLPAGNRVCLLTVSGGATSLISDLGERAGLSFPPIAAETSRKLGEALGIERDFGNPVDTVGMPRLRQEGAIDGVVGALIGRSVHRCHRSGSGHAHRRRRYPQSAGRSPGRTCRDQRASRCWCCPSSPIA